MFPMVNDNYSLGSFWKELFKLNVIKYIKKAIFL